MAIMISDNIQIRSAHSTALRIAAAAQRKRLGANWSQQTLAQRSGVSLGVLKKFERTGKISLESLLKLAHVLGELEGFAHLFPDKPPEQYPSLDILLLANKPRQRGRI